MCWSPDESHDDLVRLMVRRDWSRDDLATAARLQDRIASDEELARRIDEWDKLRIALRCRVGMDAVGQATSDRPASHHAQIIEALLAHPDETDDELQARRRLPCAICGVLGAVITALAALTFFYFHS